MYLCTYRCTNIFKDTCVARCPAASIEKLVGRFQAGLLLTLSFTSVMQQQFFVVRHIEAFLHKAVLLSTEAYSNFCSRYGVNALTLSCMSAVSA